MCCSLLKGNITKEKDKYLSFFIKKYFVTLNVLALLCAEKQVYFVKSIAVNFL